MHVLDIPTTLLTSSDIVSRIEAFWREKDEKLSVTEDAVFKEQLSQRELLNFQRMLEDVLAAKGVKRSSVFIVLSSRLDEHIASLKKS